MNENELTLQVQETAGREIVVVDQVTYEQAAAFAKALKEQQARVKDFFEEPKRKAHEAHKSITAKERQLLQPLEEAERQLKAKMGAYQLAERRRIEAEEARQREEAERLALLAAEAEAAGEGEMAAEAAAMAAVESVKVSATPKAAGVSSRQVWKFRVRKPGDVPRSFLRINEEAIAAVAKTFKDRPTMEIPGIEFYPEIITSIRG